MTEPSGVGLHQVLASASPGDAITDLALGTRDLLRRVGPSEIYARHVAPALADEVLALESYRPRHARNLLIVHASIGQSEVHEFLTYRPEPLVLVYHNVTPGRYFEPYDTVFADLLEVGRREVERLLPRVVLAIADSRYNARDLEAMGYRDVRVVPPVMNLRRLTGQTPSDATLRHLETVPGPILLSVGQLLPHKRPDFLVEMMHVAGTYLGMRGTLMLVGHQRLERYARAIKEQVLELNLSNVHLVGPVGEAELVALFRSADAIVTASEHEGFCLPLLEGHRFEKGQADTFVFTRGHDRVGRPEQGDELRLSDRSDEMNVGEIELENLFFDRSGIPLEPLMPDEHQRAPHAEVSAGDVHHLHQEVGALVRQELAY